MLAVRGRIAHLPAEVPCPANPPSDLNYSPPTPHELNNENSIFMGPEKKKMPWLLGRAEPLAWGVGKS